MPIERTLEPLSSLKLGDLGSVMEEMYGILEEYFEVIPRLREDGDWNKDETPEQHELLVQIGKTFAHEFSRYRFVKKEET